jgi:TPR repeat protein
MMYRDGIGVLRDYIEALKWYYLAARAGNERAIFLRDQLEKNAFPTQVDEAQELAKKWIAKKDWERAKSGE